MADKTSIWGVAPLAPLHLGFDALIHHQRGLRARGFNHILLLADIHAMISHGLTWKEVDERRVYYSYYFNEVCGLGATCIYGSSFQTQPRYSEDLFFLLSKLPYEAVRNTRIAGDGQLMSSWVLYATMQCLDIIHAAPSVDLVVAEPGQTKIYDLLDSIRQIDTSQANRQISDRHLSVNPAFEYVDYTHDIEGKPLNQSTTKTRISVHDTPLLLRHKIARMNAPERLKEAGGACQCAPRAL